MGFPAVFTSLANATAYTAGGEPPSLPLGLHGFFLTPRLVLRHPSVHACIVAGEMAPRRAGTRARLGIKARNAIIDEIIFPCDETISYLFKPIPRGAAAPSSRLGCRVSARDASRVPARHSSPPAANALRTPRPPHARGCHDCRDVYLNSLSHKKIWITT